jgi:hypothetical protein
MLSRIDPDFLCCSNKRLEPPPENAETGHGPTARVVNPALRRGGRPWESPVPTPPQSGPRGGGGVGAVLAGRLRVRIRHRRRRLAMAAL